MKDADGRTMVAGYYDGISFTAEDRAAMAAVPDDAAALRAMFGIGSRGQGGREPAGGAAVSVAQRARPAKRLCRSEARTVIPDQAIAAIDMRLVKETTADAIFEKFIAHVRAQGWHVVSADPDDAERARHPRIVKIVRVEGGSEAYRTSLDDPQAQRLFQALSREMGEPPVRLRTSGGTVPIEPFVRILGVPAVSVPIVNYDNNQHSENENLRLGHFFRGISIVAIALSI